MFLIESKFLNKSKKFPNLAVGGPQAGALANGGEVDTSFLEEFINENEFSNAINASNSQGANILMSNQNAGEQSTKNRNNKSKFDIYLPNI